jgi:hypothetical protein
MSKRVADKLKIKRDDRHQLDLCALIDDNQTDVLLRSTPINRLSGDAFMRKLELSETLPEDDAT